MKSQRYLTVRMVIISNEYNKIRLTISFTLALLYCPHYFHVISFPVLDSYSMRGMKFYQMRHRYEDKKRHALDLYTSDMTVDEIIITAMIQLEDTGHFQKMVQFLLDGKKNKFMRSLNSEGISHSFQHLFHPVTTISTAPFI